MEIVPFEIAKKLEEKGFSLPSGEVIGKYDSDGVYHSQLYINFTETMDSEEIIAPIISQVLKWLREEKQISIEPTIHSSLKWVSGIYSFDDGLTDFTQYNTNIVDDTIYIFYDSYEQAALTGIQYTLDNLI